MIHQLKITLLDSKPLIWRRILIPSDYTLAQLHDVIQIAMGWTDSHLHSFEIEGKSYQKIYEDFPNEEYDDFLDASKFKIKNLLKKGDKILYVYDFGDNWEHQIEVENILEKSESKPPFCTESVGICPVEDSGGIPGYYYKLQILSQPNHSEYKEIKKWMGINNYDKKISLKTTNTALAKYSKKI